VTPERLEELRARVHRDGPELIAEIERPTVRQLEWDDCVATTENAVYECVFNGDKWYWCVNEIDGQPIYDTYDAARAACQAHYERSTRAGLLLAKGE
jgi:hypothetical protein